MGPGRCDQEDIETLRPMAPSNVTNSSARHRLPMKPVLDLSYVDADEF